MIDLAERVGQSMFDWALAMNLWTGAVLAAILLLELALRRRVGAAWRIGLYAALLVRLAMPLEASTPLGLLPTPPAIVVAVTTSVPLTHAAPQDIAPPRSSAAASDLAPTASWPAFALATWVIGSLLLLAILVSSYRRLARVVDAALPAECPGSPVPVRVHPAVGPLLAGLRRPCIILPGSMLDRIAPAQLQWILRHELAHVARRDHLFAFNVSLLLIALWPILPLWIAAARLRMLIEQACDERITAGTGATEQREYTRALAAIGSMNIRRPTLVPAFAFSSGVVGRIRSLERSRRWPRWVECSLVFLLASALAACAARDQITVTEIGATGVVAEQIEQEVFDVQLTVLSTAPRLPGLDEFSLEQYVSKNSPSGEPAVYEPTYDDDVFTKSLDALKATTPGAILVAPRLRVLPAQTGTVQIGDQKADDGFTFSVTAQDAEDETVLLNIGYRERAGTDATWTLDGLALRAQPERTIVIRIPDHDDAPPRVLCLSVHPTTQLVERPVTGLAPEASGIRFGLQLHATATRVMPEDFQVKPDTKNVQYELFRDGVQFELYKDVKFELHKNTARFEAAQVNWAAIVSLDELHRVLDRLQTLEGHALLTAPTIVARPKEWAIVASVDQTNAAESYSIDLNGEVSPTGVFTQFHLSRLRSDGRPTLPQLIVRSADIAPDEAMIIVLPDRQRSLVTILTAKPTP